MPNELSIVNTQSLSTDTISKIDAQIDAFIAKHKENSVEINRIVFDGTAALVAGDNLAQNMGSHGKLKRFWRRFNGDNGRTQDTINANLIEAQYAAQKMIQKLYEENLLTFELITAVNNRLNFQIENVNDRIIGIKSTLVNFATNVRDKQNSLNAQIQDVRDEQNNLNAQIQETNARIIEIKSALVTFFKNVRADIINLSLRLDKVEKNVNLLNWQNSIEYQMYNGVEYQELDDATKIVCLARDFFDITKGEWRTSDLLLLKTAMATIGLNPKNKISYENFIRQLSANSELCRNLLGEDFSFATEYEAIAFSMNKMNRLAAEENYIVHVMNNSLAKNGINISNEDIIFQLTDEFVAQEADFYLSAEVSNYELILELLCNLVQLHYVNSLKESVDTNINQQQNEQPYEQVIKDYEESYNNIQDYDEAYNNLGIDYINLGKNKLSIQYFDKAIELNPNYDLAYYNRGIAYHNLNNYKRAIYDFDKYIQLVPNDYDGWRIRGICYQQLGDNEKAQVNFEKAKELGWKC